MTLSSTRLYYKGVVDPTVEDCYEIAALPGSVNIPYDTDWCDNVDAVLEMARNGVCEQGKGR
eukprot:8883626-Pyramimonas_sp.AAC.1